MLYNLLVVLLLLLNNIYCLFVLSDIKISNCISSVTCLDNVKTQIIK